MQLEHDVRNCTIIISKGIKRTIKPNLDKEKDQIVEFFHGAVYLALYIKFKFDWIFQVGTFHMLPLIRLPNFLFFLSFPFWCNFAC